MLGALLALWLSFAAAALPSWTQAPDPLELPAIEAPAGGWWTERGIYAEVSAAEADRHVARRLSRHAATAVPALADRLGVPAAANIDVYVAPDQAAFDRIQPGEPPHWADGTAWPRAGLVFLKSPSFRPGDADALEQVLDHEIVHVLLGQAFGARTVPRWLQEGLAQYYAGEVGPQLADQLASGLWGQGLMGIRQIASGFPADPGRARLAYAQSADLVAWIGQQHGEDALRALIRALAGGSDLDMAFRLATGKGVDAIDAEWRARLEDSPLWFRGFLATEPWWTLLFVVLGFGWWHRRRRNRRRLRRWEREEELERLEQWVN